MSFEPTEEQAAIIALGKDPESLLINALAGAAKTTTLCLLAKKLPVIPAICVAFNKSIATEMGKRMPSHIECSTLNSLGHRVWGKTVNKRLTVAADKTYEAYKAMMEAARPEKKAQMGEAFSSVLRAVRLAKSAGFVPPQFKAVGKSLVTTEELLDALSPQIDVEPDDEFMGWVVSILELSIAQAYEGRIDFDDQIYMSTLFGGAYPKYPIVMIDEAQDLSPLNHESLKKMVAVGGRLIAVGDPNQAIYGFRGAHHSSMALLAAEFMMREMTLSTSFRCPKAVVERAKWRAPNMKAADWAIEGKVEVLKEWTLEKIPDGSAIICRNNAPLFTSALRLIRAGRGVKLIGNDIGKNLLTVMSKFGPDTMTQEAVLKAIGDWQTDQLKKAREARKASINDRAECLRVFADFGKTLGEARSYAQHLFECSGPIQLMTGHKSKGLEFDTVYHLEPYLIPSKHAMRLAQEGDNAQLEQERNLRYVIETRAKKELFLISLEDMI